MAYLSNGVEKTQRKRDRKVTVLESVRAGRSEPAHGMTREEAVKMLTQDIADYDEILERLRRHDNS